jgi:hypothetical protein
MKKPSNTFRSLILFILLNSVVINAYSVSISTRRLYLDPTSNATFIRVHNMDPSVQNCDVQTNDILINSEGLISLATNGEATINSVKPLIRLAPRRFVLGTADHQMIKILYRRKPGLENGEYQGVVSIKCTEKMENSNLPVTIIPALVHNVPIIVRTGRLPIKAEFISATLSDSKLIVELKIEGERSITGDITVINSDTGDVIAEQKHLSIYAQQPVKKLELSIGEYKNAPLLIKYTEDPEMGGALMIQQLVSQ